MDAKAQSEYSVRMAFSRPSDILADHEQPGLLRSASHPIDAEVSEAFQFHDCLIKDWSNPGHAGLKVDTLKSETLNLETMGFDCIDLSGITPLMSVFEGIRQTSRISEADARAIRKHLSQQRFKLSNGKTLRILFAAPEGLILRKAGPNGLKAEPNEPMSEMNGHEGAMTVHGDQDILGTPLRQIFRGAAPWIFRHQSPCSRNRYSPIFLVNLWIPLQQITRPLTLMDRRSLNASAHQCRYALPTDTFLERDEDRRQNDIWSFLHDDNQQWYFHPDLNYRNAYVFDTLGTPHGATILPGEDVAAYYFQKLQHIHRALDEWDEDALNALVKLATPAAPENTTLALRDAINTMRGLLIEAQQGVGDHHWPSQDWQRRAALAWDRVIRKSVEVRLVALLT